MPDRAQILAAVRQVLLSTWPGRFASEQLDEEVALGEDGLGLDSIEIAEVVLACEEIADTEASAELFETGPLTIGKVAAHFCASPA